MAEIISASLMVAGFIEMEGINIFFQSNTFSIKGAKKFKEAIENAKEFSIKVV